MAKRNVVTTICVIAGLAMVGCGGYHLYQYVHKAHDITKQSVSDVDLFYEEEKDAGQPSACESGDEGCPVDSDSASVGGIGIGVMRIPALNLSHVINYGVDRKTLDRYIGMFNSFSQPGVDGTAVFSAHSAITGACPVCWFDRIEDKLKQGDTVEIDWQDGNTYTYEVQEIHAKIPVEDRSYYVISDEGQWITLVTCTHGDSNYRSFINCKRVD